MSDVKTLVCTKPTKFKIKREDVVGEVRQNYLQIIVTYFHPQWLSKNN